jgi:hypothetical protein
MCPRCLAGTLAQLEREYERECGCSAGRTHEQEEHQDAEENEAGEKEEEDDEDENEGEDGEDDDDDDDDDDDGEDRGEDHEVGERMGDSEADEVTNEEGKDGEEEDKERRRQLALLQEGECSRVMRVRFRAQEVAFRYWGEEVPVNLFSTVLTRFGVLPAPNDDPRRSPAYLVDASDCVVVLCGRLPHGLRLRLCLAPSAPSPAQMMRSSEACLARTRASSVRHGAPPLMTTTAAVSVPLALVPADVHTNPKQESRLGSGKQKRTSKRKRKSKPESEASKNEPEEQEDGGAHNDVTALKKSPTARKGLRNKLRRSRVGTVISPRSSRGPTEAQPQKSASDPSAQSMSGGGSCSSGSGCVNGGGGDDDGTGQEDAAANPPFGERGHSAAASSSSSVSSASALNTQANKSIAGARNPGRFLSYVLSRVSGAWKYEPENLNQLSAPACQLINGAFEGFREGDIPVEYV